MVFFRTGAPAAIGIARAFERAGFTVVNDSRYMQLSGHKYLANVHAQVNGIPVPDLNARVRKDNLELLSLYLKQCGSLVAKPLLSRDMGRFVYPIRSEHDLDQVGAIPGTHILLQSEVIFERLVRTVVTGAGMLAEATAFDTIHDSWKATVCDNARAKHYTDVPAELIALAERTVSVFGGDIAYIDFFQTHAGFVLNEINHSCTLTEQERITGYPIAESLGAFLCDRLEAGARELRPYLPV